MSADQITQTRRFLRGAKKLHPTVATATHEVISKIMVDPLVGEKNKADLEEFYIVKFQPFDVEYLIAYSVNQEARKIRLEAIGAHENFYRDLKRR